MHARARAELADELEAARQALNKERLERARDVEALSALRTEFAQADERHRVYNDQQEQLLEKARQERNAALQEVTLTRQILASQRTRVQQLEEEARERRAADVIA